MECTQGRFIFAKKSRLGRISCAKYLFLISTLILMLLSDPVQAVTEVPSYRTDTSTNTISTIESRLDPALQGNLSELAPGQKRP